MKEIQYKILNKLLDKYEDSVTFKGTNKQNQSFSVVPSVLFPKLNDLSDSKTFFAVREAICSLEDKKLITVKWRDEDKDYADKLFLNTENTNKVYDYIHRVPKADKNERLISIMEKYSTSCDILAQYCLKQIQNIKEGKSIEHIRFNDDFKKVEDVLKGIDALLKVEDETFIRNFSVRVYNDSKRFEAISSCMTSILYEYGDFPDKDTVMQDLNIVPNPGHVYMKGQGTVFIKGQAIDFSSFEGDIGISSELLPCINKVEIRSTKVVTIENKTTFSGFNEPDTFAIYLGGYHNQHRRNLLKKIYADNPDKEYLHFGDIDVGGFRILEHLRRKTGIPFKPYHMDAETLIKYEQYGRPLGKNEIKVLSTSYANGEFSEVVSLMLQKGIKLEQEAVAL